MTRPPGSTSLTRRSFLQRAGVGVGGGLLLGLPRRGAAADGVPGTGTGGRPNILWLVTDEHRWDAVRAYGRHAWLRTPHLDALAGNGVMFTEAYCQSPLCVASRLSMLTGRYPHHTGVYSFENSHPDTSFAVPMFTELLHREGYAVASFGKEHHHRCVSKAQPYDPTGKWYNLHLAFPDKDYMPRRPQNIEEANPSELLKGRDREAELHILRRYLTEKKLIIGGTNPMPPDQTLTSHLTDTAIDYLGKDAPRDRPLFLRLSIIAPHTPHLPPRPFDALYDPASIPLPEVTDQELRSFGRQTQTALANLRVHGMTAAEIGHMRASYYGLASYVDDQLGRTIAAFKAFCGNRPWLIVFNPDHGCKLGEHGMHEKFTFYDESVRVPLIVASSDTRFPRGTRCDRFAELVDLAPTFLGAAGIALPAQYEGLDLADTAAGRARERTETVSEKKTYGRRAMLRTHEWSFEMQVSPEPVTGRPLKPDEMKWPATATLDHLDVSLFDRRADPCEVRNLGSDQARRELCEELRRRLVARLFPEDRVEYDWWQDIRRPPNAPEK